MNEIEIRLDQTKKVFEAIAQIITKGSCSYRYLIYDMLGFKPENYAELINGLVITNSIVELEEQKNKIDKILETINQPLLNYASCVKALDEIEEILKGE